jgi:hypothetical protein
MNDRPNQLADIQLLQQIQTKRIDGDAVENYFKNVNMNEGDSVTFSNVVHIYNTYAQEYDINPPNENDEAAQPNARFGLNSPKFKYFEKKTRLPNRNFVY